MPSWRQLIALTTLAGVVALASPRLARAADSMLKLSLQAGRLTAPIDVARVDRERFLCAPWVSSATTLRTNGINKLPAAPLP